MLASLYIYLFYAFLLVAVIGAWRWGGAAERAIAGSYLLALVVSILLGSQDASSWRNIKLPLMIVDMTVMGVLISYAIQSGRWWIVTSAAIQTLATLAHFAQWAGAELRQLGYALMAGASSYPVLILLCIGIWQHRRERKMLKPYPGSSGGADVLIR